MVVGIMQNVIRIEKNPTHDFSLIKKQQNYIFVLPKAVYVVVYIN